MGSITDLALVVLGSVFTGSLDIGSTDLAYTFADVVDMTLGSLF